MVCTCHQFWSCIVCLAHLSFKFLVASGRTPLFASSTGSFLVQGIQGGHALLLGWVEKEFRLSALDSELALCLLIHRFRAYWKVPEGVFRLQETLDVTQEMSFRFQIIRVQTFINWLVALRLINQLEVAYPMIQGSLELKSFDALHTDHGLFDL